MCVKKVYYNTYADGAQDVTEKMYACHEGPGAHSPDVRKYERRLSFNKGDLDPEPRRLRPTSYYLGGELPTPRRSKSPSPLPRRDSDTHAVAGLGSPKPGRHYRDRHDYREDRRRSSRHIDADHDHVAPPKLKRTSTAPHMVVIEQGSPRFSSTHKMPSGPIHVVDDYDNHRHSTRDRTSHRRNSTTAKDFVIVDDERERRRHTQDRKRRMSSSSAGRPDAILLTPPTETYTTEPRRTSLRRSATVVVPSGGSSASSPPKHLRWEDEVRVARDRHNDEIAKRAAPEESGLKSILKQASNKVRGKSSRKEADVHGLRRAVERMDLPTGRDEARDEEELKLWDRERLLARFGGSDTGVERDRRLRSKVWTGDRYQYH